ncbi:MAG: hypothetical protein WBG86_05180, partial [Polyangiales bacterium]
VNATRAVAAGVGCMAVVRIGLWRPLENRRPAMILLGAMAVLSVASFYNLGFPQFWDNEARRPTFVHGHDLRVYFPTAKYFDELGYDGVYLASVQAYSEDRLDGTLRGIEDIEVRDLRDYEMRAVEEIEPEIRAVRSRFSPERWEGFKRDMAYFWRSMGERGYFDSLRDHGGNATPAWLWIAHVLYGSADAEDAVFWRWGLLDPLLLLALFLVAWRTFGLRAALVSMIVFGGTTFYQLGSNWGGATLRNDWMVLLGFGICALAVRRDFLAGALLGWSAMIRAFPAVALVFVAAWFGLVWFRARSSHANASVVRTVIAPFAQLVAGVLAIVLVLGVASSATFGFEESWVAWGEKIGVHVNDPNVNHVGLTALVGYKTDNLWDNLRDRGEDPRLWKPLTRQTVRERWWIRAIGVLIFMGLAVVATARNRLADAAILGTMMIPVIFYPSNYYLHCLFLWPLLLARKERDVDRDWAVIATTLLALCAAQWFGWLIPGRYGQFLVWSGMLLIAMLVVLIVAARHHPTPAPQTLEKG